MKKDGQGNEVDFNRVYAELIRPVLEATGVEVFRTDEEESAGDIRTDMFQELRLAALVVVNRVRGLAIIVAARVHCPTLRL
ncbi:MAG: hypothetical protein P0120_10520 [Nitrospira sp.]|nr:hypothetical protein [Nitrospira sp.]